MSIGSGAFIVWSGKRHPASMGAIEIRGFLKDLNGVQPWAEIRGLEDELPGRWAGRVKSPLLGSRRLILPIRSRPSLPELLSNSGANLDRLAPITIQNSALEIPAHRYFQLANMVV